MRKAGVPDSVIMAITGHSTREMFDRYNTVDADDPAKLLTSLKSISNLLTKLLTKYKKKALPKKGSKV